MSAYETPTQWAVGSRGFGTMRRRDPSEHNRTANQLELLFDLAFVIAFGQAADQLTHNVTDGHLAAGVGGFVFAMITVSSVWLSFTWFGSAFGIDDWAYRTVTMVQMVGVLVLAVGLPDLFRALAGGGTHVNVRVMVAGYLVMRLATLLQWIRVGFQDQQQRYAASQHGVLVVAASIGWAVVAITAPNVAVFSASAALLFLLEIGGSRIVENCSGELKWNPVHIAERFGLLTIVALGEGVFGTVASVSSLVKDAGWSLNAVIVVVAGVGLTFGLWWMYFMVPYEWILSWYRSTFRPIVFLHFFLYAAIVATGAGLHVASSTGQNARSSTVAVLAVSLPVGLYCLTVMAAYTFVQRKFDRLHAKLFTVTLVVLVGSILLSFTRCPIGVSLLLTTLAPLISVFGYETSGWRHQHHAISSQLRESHQND